jgi:predicted DNA-binding ribbon-helix-helix protein
MRDWQRQYRLAKKRWHYQIVRLDHDDAQMLKAIAKRRNTSVAELIRTYVTWGLEEDDSARRPDDL